MSVTKEVTVFTEERFLKDSSGQYYSPFGYDTQFWMRYLSVFSHVAVAARVQLVDDAQIGELKPVSHPNLRFQEVPYYRGLGAYLMKFLQVRVAVISICKQADTVILRMPGQLSNIASSYLIRTGKEYGVELVGDPEDVFGNGGAGGMFRGIISRLFLVKTRNACFNAKTASYVTKHILQSKYPLSPGKPSASYSSIVLNSKSILDTSRTHESGNTSCNLVTVGSLAQLTKGVDTLLESLVRIVKELPQAKLTVVGDGHYRGYLEQMARDLGVENNVEFLGFIPTEQIFAVLDESDLFVLGTRGEGLPRVIIEAMARALPAISTNVSGIPELLEEQYMLEPGDAEGFANRILDLVRDAGELDRLSARNLEMSRDFEQYLMQRQRVYFYNCLIGAETATALEPDRSQPSHL